MKKKIYLLFTFISIVFLIFSIYLQSTYYSFSSKNVKNNIEYLSSNKLEGRLPGSKSNEEVAMEIKKEFIDFGLKPLDNSYVQEYKVQCPIYTGDSCSLKIMDKESVIKEFKLGTDYKEDMLNFKSSTATFTNADKISIFPKAILIEQGDKKYIFYVTFEKNFPFRSSFIYDSSFEFALQINTNTFNEILTSLRKGYTIDVNLPYKVEEKTVYNIVGKIEGSNNSLKPLIISAHFDHLGKDSLGNVYCGALDNGSGTSFLLELARNYSSLMKPKRDIIFVALNCEEFGLLGSEYFASKYASKYEGAVAINFDMVGIDNLPITFIDGKENVDKPSKLLSILQSVCLDNNFKYEVKNQNSSDHASFINNGFNSVTIAHSELTNIHTPRDTAEKISTNAIDNMYTLINDYIIEYAYSDTTLILYSKLTLTFFTISSASLLIFYFISIRNYKDKV